MFERKYIYKPLREVMSCTFNMLFEHVVKRLFTSFLKVTQNQGNSPVHSLVHKDEEVEHLVVLVQFHSLLKSGQVLALSTVQANDWCLFLELCLKEMCFDEFFYEISGQ